MAEGVIKRQCICHRVVGKDGLDYFGLGIRYGGALKKGLRNEGKTGG
jgi:hypothetical protein